MNRAGISNRTLTNTLPPVPLTGFPVNPSDTIVVVVLNNGLKKEILGKKGEDNKYWVVDGRG